MKTWNQKARELMQERGITTSDLAAALGVTPGAVRHYLNGNRHPRPGALGKIARRLGVSMSELTEDDPRFARDKGEEKILGLLRELDPQAKDFAVKMLEGLSAKTAPDDDEST
jgi:transcriptional regulator with XRE-family HTH domain